MSSFFIEWIKNRLFRLSDASMVQERTRKLVMLYTIILVGVVLLLALGSLAYLNGDYPLALLDLGLSLFFIGFFIYLRLSGNLAVGSFVGVAVIFFFFLILFATGAADHQAFMWYYSFPLISLFLLGLQIGTASSLLLIGLSLLICLFRDFLPFYTPYPEGQVLRLFFSYMVVLVFAHLFESTRRVTREQLESAMQNLNELAIRDGLTGLYNRRYFDEVIQRVLNQVSRDGNTVAFLMADLDFFKGYNDAYGHRAGDAVLNTFASVLNAQVRRKTDHAFRYGGEEFALLLSPTNRETALRFADQLIADTEELKIPHASSPFGVLTVSVGVALVRIDQGVTMQHMIDLADQALYEAKNRGRNGRVIKEEVS